MTDPITPEYLDELAALSGAATEGEWMDTGGIIHAVAGRDVGWFEDPCDSEFIAAARQAVPRLVKAQREADKAYEHMKDRAEAAEAEVAKLRKYIRSVTSKSEAKRVLTLLKQEEADRRWKGDPLLNKAPPKAFSTEMAHDVDDMIKRSYMGLLGLMEMREADDEDDEG